jgi:U3 small nucleolar RNA-associated protein 11
MSSYRNVIHRREHKERSQPQHRKKYGFLEKHKDYKQRAVNYHKKEDIIKNLTLKASLRNPDEFYYGMVNKSTKKGVETIANKAIDRTGKQLKSMKEQDHNYLQMKIKQDQNTIHRMKENLHLLDQNLSQQSSSNNNNPSGDELSEEENNNSTSNNSHSNARKHVIFVDSTASAAAFSPAEYFQTDEAFINRSYNRPTKAQLENNSIIVNGQNITPESLNTIERKRAGNYRELVDRIDRKRKISELNDRIQQQRLLMTKGTRKKIVQRDQFGDIDESKTRFEWKQERKK